MELNRYINGQHIPLTQEELAEIAVLREAAQKELAKTQYQELRRAEYPPITDYIDGVVKGDQAQIDKYIADCLAVKQKYPKPIAE